MLVYLPNMSLLKSIDSENENMLFKKFLRSFLDSENENVVF